MGDSTPTPALAPAHPILAEILADLETFANSSVGQALIALLLSKLTPATTQAVHAQAEAIRA